MIILQYDDDTQLKLIQEAIDASPENGWIACLCSPSVFVKYKVNLLLIIKKQNFMSYTNGN